MVGLMWWQQIVSILVLVEVLPWVLRDKVLPPLNGVVVSILVLVEVLPWATSSVVTLCAMLSFNPCSGGSIALGKEGRAWR